MEPTIAINAELLGRGLADLFACANSNDIVRTAADLELSVEQVRRYLRGNIYELETGQKIHDRLRELTLERAHGIIEKLGTAA